MRGASHPHSCECGYPRSLAAEVTIGVTRIGKVLGEGAGGSCFPLRLIAQHFFHGQEAVVVAVDFLKFLDGLVARSPKRFRHFVIIQQAVAVLIQAAEHAFGPAVRIGGPIARTVCRRSWTRLRIAVRVGGAGSPAGSLPARAGSPLLHRTDEL